MGIKDKEVKVWTFLGGKCIEKELTPQYSGSILLRAARVYARSTQGDEAYFEFWSAQTPQGNRFLSEATKRSCQSSARRLLDLIG